MIWGGFTLLVLFGVAFLVRDSLRYLEWTEDVYRRFWPQRIMLATHVLTASLALIVAPIQFSGRIRQRWPKFHRGVGWFYVVCALASGLAMFRLGFYSCPECVPPFAIWSFLFFTVTALALLMAIRRRFEAHRQFMMRSWVLMNGFVFVRLDTYVEYPLPAGPGVNRAAIVLWVSWVVPLLATEMFLSWYPLAARKRAEVKSRVNA